MLDALKSRIRNHPSLSWAFIVSAALLAVFCGLQVAGSSILTLPVQWIWISVLPILVALITGGYIRKMEFFGQKFETWRPGTKDVGPQPPPAQLKTSGVTPTAETGSEPWQAERDKEYDRVGGKELGGLFLAHIYKPSTLPGQRFDVTIFLIRHRYGDPNSPYKQAFSDIKHAKFYLGPSWGQGYFLAPNEGGFIGIRTSAWGTFLATCQVTFTDRKPALILHRFIDFEMAPPLA